MQNQNFLTRKNIFLLCTFVLLVFGLIFFFSNTVLVLENNEGEKTVEIRGEDGSLRNFKLKDKKWMILPRGKYSISVTSEYRFSSYTPRLGSFYKKLFLETAPQRQSFSVGASDFGCAAGKPEKPFFFPCENYFGSVEVVENSEATLIEIDPVEAKHDHLPGESGAQNASLSFAASPLGDRLLSLRSENGILTAKYVDAYALSDTKTVELSKDFNGHLKNKYVSVSGESFAVFDQSKKQVMLFENINDSQPEMINFGEKLSDIENGKDVMLALSKNNLFLVLSKSFDALDEIDEETASKYGEAGRRTLLFSVSLGSPNGISEYNVPGSIIAKGLSASDNDRVVITPQYDEARPALEFFGGKFTELSLPSGVTGACWHGDSLFFGSSDDQIFEYSFEKEGAFLAYESQWGDLVDINCGNGLFFGVVPSGEVASNSAGLRFLLTDEESKGPRLDGVLPFYYTYNADTYLVEQAGKDVRISLNYDSNGNGPSPGGEVKAKVLEELKAKTRLLSVPALTTTF